MALLATAASSPLRLHAVMKSVLLALIWPVPGYFIGLFGGIWLVPYLSRNAHDGSVEAAMTGAFLIGPLLAVAAFVTGLVYHRSRRGRAPQSPV